MATSTPKGSRRDIQFGLALKRAKLPMPVTEHRFHPTRRWRFDYAWPEKMVAVEVQGGIWTRGAHSRGVGLTRDYAKLNEAQAMGWIVLQVVPAQLASPDTVDLVQRCFGLNPRVCPG